MKQGDPTRQSWQFTVELSDADQRLDQIVPAKTNLSRRKVRDILKLGGIQVNGRRVRVAGRVPPEGSEIRVTVDESLGQAPNFEPEILYEDDWILALNKPSGIPTQGTLASDRHDFFAVARRYFASQKLFLVHRLDTGTSGVLMLAKTPSMAAKIGKLFQDRGVKKTYLAATSGRLEPCSLDMPIGRVPAARPARYGCTGNLVDVKPAVTNFYSFDPSQLQNPRFCNSNGVGRLRRNKASSEERADGEMEDAGENKVLQLPHPSEINLPPCNWAVAEPLTGRTHQIRVHLAHLGNPVIGDTLYGGPPSGRLWLHAWKLQLFHPEAEEMIEIKADVDFWHFAVSQS